MSIRDLWAGVSPAMRGYTNFNQNAELRIYEGYLTGATYEYADIGRVYVNEVKYRLDESSNYIQVSAGSELKKLANWVAHRNYSYESAFRYSNSFNQPEIPSEWTQNSDNWNAGGSQLLGVSNSVGQGIFLTKGPELDDVFYEVKGGINADSNDIYLIAGIRANNVANYTSLEGYVIDAEPGRNQIVLQQFNGNGTATNYFQTTGISLGNNDIYLRIIGIRDRIYGFYSLNGSSWTWLGSSWATLSIRERGRNFNIVFNGTQSIDSTNTFTYKPLYDVNYLVKDVAFKAGLYDTHIPNIYSSNFTDITGLTYTGSTWTFSNNIATGIGMSSATQWGLLYSGLSFQDFNLEVDVNIGLSSFAGVFFGSSTNNFNGIYFRGNNASVGLTCHVMDPSNELMVNGSRVSTSLTLPINHIYANTWNRLNIVKTNDIFYYLINDLVVYSYQGTSGFNLDANNIVGLMIRRNVGITQTAQFRNLKVKSLSTIASDFQITANSSAESVYYRLQNLAPFKYLMSGLTLNIIPQLGSSDISLRTYNIGESQTSWNIDISKTDGLVNHVIVYGGNGTKADAWDEATFERLNEEERVKVITDESLLTNADCLVAAKQTLADLKKNNTTLNFKTNAQVDLEKYDVLTIVNKYTGTSENFRISNEVKSFDPERGEFTHMLSLGTP